jgi:NAD(P)-dependent dehydrogenase (short-subunit alcohol dehydrogenase family)
VWTEADMPDQSGRLAVVTGANTGIGFETARMLAARGAIVVLACRDLDKATDAVARIGAAAHVVRLDLASLASVREAAAELRDRFPRIDLLVNNAGVTGLRGTTADGVEVQFGVNHLGHFALTGLLLDRVAGRVVTVSSIGHRFGRARDWDSPRNAYARSKLANLLFTFGLARRLDSSPVLAGAAHPGGASTEIFRSSPGWSWVEPRDRAALRDSWLPHHGAGGAPRPRHRGAGPPVGTFRTAHRRPLLTRR